ncbi:Annexin, partial [Opisthorchis viverrini]
MYRLQTVLSAEFDEDEYSFLLTVQLEKPGAPKRRKPLRERIREQSAPRKSPDMEDTKPVKETRPTTAKSEQATASKQPYQKEYVQSERKPSPKKEDKEERTEAEPPKQKAPEPYFVTEEVEVSIRCDLSVFVCPNVYKHAILVLLITQYSPTLKPYPNFNAPDDCERLRKAMKGIGTDEKTIIEIMGARTASQRTQIVLQFKTMYGKDLIKEFSSELSGRFYDCVEALCYSPAEFDARQLRKAVKGMGTDESALIEILCSRTNDQIRQIKEAYTKVNPGRDLEKDVISDTSGNFKRIMVSLLQANRDESLTFDRNAARRDAEDLYEAGEKNLGTDESKFNMLLASKSFAYLRAVFVEYANVSKSDIETSIKKEMSGDLRKTMLAI